MKTIKIIFKTITIIFLSLIGAFVIVFFIKRIPSKETFYINNAKFNNYEYLRTVTLEMIRQPLEHSDDSRHYPTKVHEIISGNKIVFGYRYFQDSIPIIAIDDEHYEKITFAIPEHGLSNVEYSLPDERLEIIYTSGGSAWIQSGCFGYPSTGKISFKKVSNDQIAVKGKFLVHCEYIDSFKTGESKEIVIDDTFTRFDLSLLSHYLGKPGGIPYNSTYR